MDELEFAGVIEMTINELKAVLDAAECRYEVIQQDKPILSATDAEGIYPVEKSAPTFVLHSEQGLIGCIVSMQNGRLDFERLKAQFCFEKLKMADRKKIEKATGYSVGSVPLAALGLPIIFDKKLLCHDFVYGGTGNELLTLKIKPEDLIKANEILGFFE